MSSDSPTGGPAPVSPPRSSGPSIGQAIVWGAMAAAFGSLFAFIGSLLSEKSGLPPATDPLHGASTPAEMNRQVDALLAASRSAITHDSALVTKLGIAVVLLAVLVVACTVWIIVRRRLSQLPPPPKWHTVSFALLLAVPPIVITCGAVGLEGRLLQSSPISRGLRNANTDPPVVPPGTSTEIEIPTTQQSWFGYYECSSFTLKRVTATLPSGEQVPVALTGARVRDGGRKPDKTDLAPLMENVEVGLIVTIPNDPTLSGSVVDLGVVGLLRLIPSNSKQPIASGQFDAAARFRVARHQEASFQADCDALSSRMMSYNWFSFGSAAVAVIGLTMFVPWFCRRCRGRVNPFKIMDGHLCPACSRELRKAPEVNA